MVSCLDNFEVKVNSICSQYLESDKFEVFNGSLFYTAPLSLSRKVFSQLMREFDMRCSIQLIELDYYVVDFVD